MGKIGRLSFDWDKKPQSGSEAEKSRSAAEKPAEAGLVDRLKENTSEEFGEAKNGFLGLVQRGKNKVANLLDSSGGPQETDAPEAGGRPKPPPRAAEKRPKPVSPAEEARRGAKHYEFLLEQTAITLESDEDEGIAGEMIDEWDQALDPETLPGLRAMFSALRGGSNREVLRAWIAALNGLGLRRYPSETADVNSPEELAWYFSGQTHSVGETLVLERRPWLLDDPVSGKTVLISRGLIRKTAKPPEGPAEDKEGEKT